MLRNYRGRFAPSPTGPLHRGSLVAALASWLDARANHGNWLIRIEDIDPPREHPGAAAEQITLLARFGMISDEPVLYQSTRAAAYKAALQQLSVAGRAFGCDCTRGRRQGESAGARVARYPGTCRNRTLTAPAAMRLLVLPGMIGFQDRACGWFAQDVERSVGDFVIQRADGLWAYQLAVVVDDAFQEVTDVVRGADLLDNTPRQICLQQALGLPTPRYLHLPLVLDAAGRKLSKQTQACAIDAKNPLTELERAWRHLGFEPTGARNLDGFLQQATDAWRARWYGAGREPAGPASLDARDGP